MPQPPIPKLDENWLELSTVLLLIVCALATPGCSSSGVNPSAPHANTGYVDFYTDDLVDLSWEVKCKDERTGKMETVFAQYKPLQTSVLRIASPPSEHQFQVWFMNLTTEGPQTVQVRVENGKITPVHVTLATGGTTFIRQKEYSFRGSAKGYARGTKVTTTENKVFQIGATAEPSQPYKTKEEMPYFAIAAKE